MLVRPEVPGYDPPDWAAKVQQAAPRSWWREYLDVAILGLGIAAAGWLGLVRRSRRGLLLLTVASVLWLGFWRKGCVCPIGAIQNVSLAIADANYTLPLAVALVFALPILGTIFFGRTFCAAVCPLGAIQEIVALHPVKLPEWVDHVFGLIGYVYLGLAVMFAVLGTSFVICQYDPFVAFFRLGGSLELVVVGIGFLLAGIFITRPYCRFLCPLGAVFRCISPLARWHVRIPPEACIQCRLCENVCPYNAISPPAAPLRPSARRTARQRFLMAAAMVPIWVLMGGVLGRLVGPILSRADARIQLADRVWLEERGQVEGTTDASDAFRKSGAHPDALYAEAAMRQLQYQQGGMWLGIWIGLVVGLKIVQLSRYRTRDEYEPERSRCFSCGRCFWYCPVEQKRLGLIEDLAPYLPEAREKSLQPVASASDES